jgi:hypothetical protein
MQAAVKIRSKVIILVEAGNVNNWLTDLIVALGFGLCIQWEPTN